MKLYTATVIDIDDKDKKGKIKIQILPELEGVDEELLPWAVPFQSEVSEKTLSNNLPSLESTIWVLVDETWKRFFYLNNRYFEGLFEFSNVENVISKIAELNDKEYKNLDFILYEDGSVSFHNNSDGSHGFVQKNGTYQIFDKDGNITINTGKNKFVLKNELSDIKDILDRMQTVLQNLATPMNLVAPNGPVTYNKASEDLPDMIKLKTDISNLMGE